MEATSAALLWTFTIFDLAPALGVFYYLQGLLVLFDLARICDATLTMQV